MVLGARKRKVQLEVGSENVIEEKHPVGLVGNTNVSHSGQPLAAAGFHMLSLLYHSE